MLAAAQVQTVSRVDLDRCLGQWHEVARYPNRFQKSCASDVVATAYDAALAAARAQGFELGELVRMPTGAR